MIFELEGISVPFYLEQNEMILNELEKRGIKKENIKRIDYLKKSIDSRNQNNIKYIYNLEIELEKNLDIAEIKSAREVNKKKEILRKANFEKKNIVIVGAGPAGLFAALRLAEYGLKPILIERGKRVEERLKDVENFWKLKDLNENSNVQFGEGGAGTFSDGKLTTRIRSEYIEKIFNEFVEAGASKEILYDYKPHIGSDILINVVKNIREKIIKLGGQVLFETKLTDIKIKNGKVSEIEINNKETIECEHLILAIGHSARDTFEMLYKRGIYFENKDFAIGVRIEHPQELINKMQYGKYYNSEKLPNATYSFTYNTEDKRGIFSFCMCPGGVIVNSASEKKGTLVNGMSYSKRDGKFANSAIVVAIGEKDYGKNIFDGMRYQEKLEKKAYEICGGYGAVYQKLFDFLKDKKSKGDIETSFLMHKESVNLNNFFPEVISINLKKAFKFWSKNKFFINEEANLLGPETRTSSPVKIKRNEKMQSISCENIYPVGEGAGYAGGITSAAVDGIKCVDINFTIEM